MQAEEIQKGPAKSLRGENLDIPVDCNSTQTVNDRGILIGS